jgi:5'-methylthioinosine phosphorylase
MGVFIGSAPLDIDDLQPCGEIVTPWGNAACVPMLHRCGGHEMIFMPRHGAQHEFAPHQINYRANVWLMHKLQVDYLVGTYTVGSVDPALEVGQLVVPHQLIDYTWGRDSTYDDELRHAEFADPYDAELIDMLAGIDSSICSGGVYGATQGPRLETAAEIARLGRDGCTLVGMTGMPEAALARELNLRFAALCLVVNPAAGIGDEQIDLEAMQVIAAAGGKQMVELLERLLDAVV